MKTFSIKKSIKVTILLISKNPRFTFVSFVTILAIQLLIVLSFVGFMMLINPEFKNIIYLMWERKTTTFTVTKQGAVPYFSMVPYIISICVAFSSYYLTYLGFMRNVLHINNGKPVSQKGLFYFFEFNRAFNALLLLFLFNIGVAMIYMAVMPLLESNTFSLYFNVISPMNLNFGLIEALKLVNPLNILSLVAKVFIFSRWIFSFPVLIEQKVGPLKAVEKSWQLTAGKILPLLGWILIITFFASLLAELKIAWISIIGQAIVPFLGSFFIVAAYRQLVPKSTN